MSINKFGQSSLSSKSSIVNQSYVNAKFIAVSNNLTTKLDKTGGTMNGDINMGNNKITSNHIPNSDEELVNKKYIDSLTPSTLDVISINSKVNKSGDTMTGNLNMGNNRISSSYVPTDDNDLVNKKHFDALIAHRLDDNDLRIIYNTLSLKVAKSGDTMTGNLNMGYNKITSQYTPSNEYDLINKKYLNLNYAASSVGYVPDLVGNSFDKSGFTVSASSEIAGYPAFCAFNRWKEEWRVSDRSNMWIQVKCPQSVRLSQFALRGKNVVAERVLRWKLEASNNGTTWILLYSTDTNHLSNEIKFFQPTISPLASYYKLTLIESEGTNPGLRVFQLYTYDKVESPYLSDIVSD